MKFLKSFITLGCIALQTVACATVPTFENGLQIQEGNYRTSGNVPYCDGISTVTWDGQTLTMGANIIFVNVNGPAITEKNDYSSDECTFTSVTRAEGNRLMQEEKEVCNKAPAYETTNISNIVVQGNKIIYTKQTTQNTNSAKRPVFNVSCQFVKVR